MANLKPAKPCKNKNGRCPGLVRSGVCDTCGADANKLKRKRENQNRQTPAELGYDYRWSKIRKIFIDTHPFCAECERQGRTTLGDDVDHIIPLSEGGTSEDANLQTLCRKCHNLKTHSKKS